MISSKLFSPGNSHRETISLYDNNKIHTARKLYNFCKLTANVVYTNVRLLVSFIKL